jgi:signal transduction histidine kinase
MISYSAKHLVDKAVGNLFGAAGVAAVTTSLVLYHALFSSTTIALAFLLVALFAADRFRRPPGSRTKITAERATGDMIRIAVEDEGQGVPPELREHVFDKFFRATSEAAESAGGPKGIGMGLAIARGIVDAHGGKIRIESGENVKGTRAVFTIPIGDEDPIEAQEGLSPSLWTTP